MSHFALQLAAAAEVNQAEESEALSSLADSGFSSSSAVATAVHNCRYRPYIARQVPISSPVHCQHSVRPAQDTTVTSMGSDCPTFKPRTIAVLRTHYGPLPFSNASAGGRGC